MTLQYQRLPLTYANQVDAFRRIGNAVNWLLNNLDLDGADTGLVTYSATITLNAGDGTPHGDLNATDFTGHPRAEGDSLRIASNAVVTFSHNANAYLWTGPTDVLVGGTQAGRYTATASDLTPIGTADHALLVNREIADAHPQSAVTGLVAGQQAQDDALTAHVNNASNPHTVLHSQLSDTGGNDKHPMSAITGLLADQQRQDDALQTHLDDPGDPHPIYSKKLPGLILGGTADSFTLNTTDSKIQGYSLAGEWYWEDQDDIDPVNGNIVIPQSGIWRFTANVLGNQGNDTKEEWIELRLDTTGAGPQPPGRETISIMDVTTDKTNYRQVQATVTRGFYADEVLSLWMWASAGLGTFTVLGTTFELVQLAEIGDLVTP